jgi:hypothetical protein
MLIACWLAAAGRHRAFSFSSSRGVAKETLFQPCCPNPQDFAMVSLRERQAGPSQQWPRQSQHQQHVNRQRFGVFHETIRRLPHDVLD